MKSICAIVVLALLSVQSIFASPMEYGLHFNSHSFVAVERTRLRLSPDIPLPIGDDFRLDFTFAVRREPQFGSMLRMTLDNGEQIHAVFSSSDNETYFPALLVNDKLTVLGTPVPHEYVQSDLSIVLDRDGDEVRIVFGGDSISAPVKIGSAVNCSVLFGQIEDFDVAPVDIRDIKVSVDGDLRHHWQLKNHNDSVCYDLVAGVVAVADNPHWILDDHVAWTTVFHLKTNDVIQTAYNSRDNLFYIVNDEKVDVLDPVDGHVTTIPVAGGYRAMRYSNHLEYDLPTQTLISFSLSSKLLSRFDFSTRRWSLGEPNMEEPTNANHAWAVNDSIAYSFGGYGFYHYTNNLYQINLNTGSIEERTPRPTPDPRNSATAAVANGKLYVFGGKGNDWGRQEMPARYYYDLYEYDLNTLEGAKLWEMDTVSFSFILAPTMYYDAEKRCFYAATTQFDGSVLRIYLDEPKYDRVSRPLQTSMGYKDFVFNFYKNEQLDKYYLLVDKRFTDLSHELSIYSIDGPFMPDAVTTQEIPKPKGSKTGLFVVLLVVLAAGIVVLILHRRKRASHSDEAAVENEADATSEASEAETGVLEPMDDGQADYAGVEALKGTDIPHYYDRSRSAISFLGGFNVRDKEGNDMTTSFTSRSKNLLILLLLYSEKYKNGVLISRLDEIIWADKDEESARNNRNVYMRKLRLLLERIGNINITFDSGYFRINLNDVFFDYHTAIEMIERVNAEGNIDSENLDRTLELQLFGTLLPHTHYEWLDQFKSDYSRMSITLLNNLLGKKMNEKEESMAFRIAETILLHDPLSEEALRAKCVILCRRKMMGLAKDSYDNFCREYTKSLGEEYKVAFADICKPASKDRAGA